MELAIATPKGKKGTVEVSELAFGKEFNQDLVPPVIWSSNKGKNMAR